MWTQKRHIQGKPGVSFSDPQLNCKLHFTLTVYTFAIKSGALFDHSLAQCVTIECRAMKGIAQLTIHTGSNYCQKVLWALFQKCKL